MVGTTGCATDRTAARAIATTVAFFRGSAMSCGTCRGNPRISTVARGNTHGSSRKFGVHPGWGSLWDIRRTAVALLWSRLSVCYVRHEGVFGAVLSLTAVRILQSAVYPNEIPRLNAWV